METIRPARATDAAECSRIIYAAFTDIADRHGFSRPFPSPEVPPLTVGHDAAPIVRSPQLSKPISPQKRPLDERVRQRLQG
jgi:hypothetical protein